MAVDFKSNPNLYYQRLNINKMKYKNWSVKNIMNLCVNMEVIKIMLCKINKLEKEKSEKNTVVEKAYDNMIQNYKDTVMYLKAENELHRTSQKGIVLRGVLMSTGKTSYPERIYGKYVWDKKLQILLIDHNFCKKHNLYH